MKPDRANLDAIIDRAAADTGMKLEAFRAAQHHTNRNRAIRNEAILEALALGFGRAEIGRAFGVRPKMVDEIRRAESKGVERVPNRPHRDLTGMVFGHLTVVDGRTRECICECKCGNRVPAMAYALIAGNRRSCGCLQSRIGGGHTPQKPRGMTREQVAWARGVCRGGPSAYRGEAGLILLFYHEMRIEKQLENASKEAADKAYWLSRREQSRRLREMRAA